MNHEHAGTNPKRHVDFSDDGADVLDQITAQLEIAENADPAESVEILAAVTSQLNTELEADQGES